VLKKKPLSNEGFLRHVRDYLPMDASVWNTDETGKPASCAITAGMVENHFYLFDGEATLAASHAIEELALEEATGFLLATMQHFRNFEPHRERYWQLAATLEEAWVIAKGKRPPRHGHLKFIGQQGRTLAPFWTVLYQGHNRQAMLVCRQVNDAKEFEQKRFEGFYTFNPGLIVRVRQDIEELLAGRAGGMREFERMRAIDRAAKRLGAQFAREHRVVEDALRRLQIGGDRYEAQQFAADLEKSLNRLKLLTNKLPDLVGAAGSRLAA
jgi:hypothetical protein